MSWMQAKWVNNDGLDMSVFVPTKWISYLFTGGLVAVTLIFMALYALNGMTWLVACSCVSLAALAVSLYFVAKGPDLRYINVNYAEIVFFMVVNVAFLGTDYGFQLYCFGFVTSAMFMSLTAGSGGKVLWQSWLFIGLSAAYFLAVTLWFGFHEPLYSFNSPLIAMIVYILNATTTMASIVLFTTVYMITATNLGQRLTVAASHDELTGLFNRRGIYPIIEDAFESNAGRAGFCYFAMLDIDHFKNINDQFGHKCGDTVLQNVSAILTDYTHRCPELQVSRWGGEEFLLIYAALQDDVPEMTRPGEALEIGFERIGKLFEELRLEIGNSSVSVGETDLRCTATIGVADFAEGATADEALNLADKRLYDGKQAGRNRVILGPATQES